MFSVICMHQGVRVTQFQFSVCMYGTCGRIDNKADFDFFLLCLLDEKCSKIFSLVSWGIFLLSAFYIKQVKLSTIG